jgi:hypothetical protein
VIERVTAGSGWKSALFTDPLVETLHFEQRGHPEEIDQ